jgi:RNA polymerase sigma factor (sigma-70 family)
VTPKLPFEEVVSRYGPTVSRVCRAILGVIDADDAWSETFLSALEAYPRLPDDANVEAWLVTIAHRRALDAIRRTNRHAVPVAELPTPSDLHVDQSRDLDLARTLATLPDKQRFVLVYHYLAGLPYRQVAAIVGGSPEAARRAAADGVASLRHQQGTIR